MTKSKKVNELESLLLIHNNGEVITYFNPLESNFKNRNGIIIGSAGAETVKEEKILCLGLSTCGDCGPYCPAYKK